MIGCRANGDVSFRLRTDLLSSPFHQVPAILGSAVATLDAPMPRVPALIADLGEPAAWRYVEFFTAHIRNPNTRRA